MGFEGCYTAIVTPFKGSGERVPIDWGSFKRLLQFQDENGAAGVVACGSTGESATLSMEEHNQVIEYSVNHSKGATIAGTGSNSTWEAVEMTRHAEDVGAAASLQVCPYYNKPNQEGLYRHFARVAEAVDMPIILYNVPSRTAREIDPETMARLAIEYSNIIGVKEASGRKEYWDAVKMRCPDDFLILSGNDEDTFALMKNYGAVGVISVASNVFPKLISDFTAMGLQGRFREMEKEAKRLSELFRVLFIDTNPIPIKHAMNWSGLNAGGFRLPLCDTDDEKKREIEKVLTLLLD